MTTTTNRRKRPRPPSTLSLSSTRPPAESEWVKRAKDRSPPLITSSSSSSSNGSKMVMAGRKRESVSPVIVLDDDEDSIGGGVDDEETMAAGRGVVRKRRAKHQRQRQRPVEELQVKNFDSKRFTTCYPRDLSMEEQEQCIGDLRDAVERHTALNSGRSFGARGRKGRATAGPMNYVVVQHLQDMWESELEQRKRSIAARVARHLLKEDWDSTHTAVDICREDARFKRINALLQSIDNLIGSYTREFTMDLHIIEQRKNLEMERSLRKRKRQERNEQEQETLKRRPAVRQLMFFIERFGPLKGRSEYSEWSSTNGLAAVLRSVSAAVDGALCPSSEVSSKATAAICTVANTSDPIDIDALLNEDLL